MRTGEWILSKLLCLFACILFRGLMKCATEVTKNDGRKKQTKENRLKPHKPTTANLSAQVRLPQAVSTHGSTYQDHHTYLWSSPVSIPLRTLTLHAHARSPLIPSAYASGNFSRCSFGTTEYRRSHLEIASSVPKRLLHPCCALVNRPIYRATIRGSSALPVSSRFLNHHSHSHHEPSSDNDHHHTHGSVRHPRPKHTAAAAGTANARQACHTEVVRTVAARTAAARGVDHHAERADRVGHRAPGRPVRSCRIAGACTSGLRPVVSRSPGRATVGVGVAAGGRPMSRRALASTGCCGRAGAGFDARHRCYRRRTGWYRVARGLGTKLAGLVRCIRWTVRC